LTPQSPFSEDRRMDIHRALPEQALDLSAENLQEIEKRRRLPHVFCGSQLSDLKVVMFERDALALAGGNPSKLCGECWDDARLLGP